MLNKNNTDPIIQPNLWNKKPNESKLAPSICVKNVTLICVSSLNCAKFSLVLLF